MKYALILATACAMGLSCCQSVPPVPPSNRTVVKPQGSTGIEKAWGGITPKEGDALLGPLNNMRR